MLIHNSQNKINRLKLLSLVTLLQTTSFSFTGLCNSKPVAPENRRSSVTSEAGRSEELNRVIAALEAYTERQREIAAAFMLGRQEGVAAHRIRVVVAPAPVPVIVPADTDAELELRVTRRRLSDKAREA